LETEARKGSSKLTKMRRLLNRHLRELVKKGGQTSLDDAVLAVFENEEFKKSFSLLVGGRNEKKKEAVFRALGTLHSDMDLAKKAATPLKRASLKLGREVWHGEHRTTYRAVDGVEDSMKQINNYASTLIGNRTLKSRFDDYAPLSKQVVDEVSELASKAGSEIPAPITIRKLPNIPWRRIVTHPVTPLKVGLELIRATEVAPGFRWKSFKDVKSIRRLVGWAAVYGGAYWGISKLLKMRRNSLEKALALKEGPLLKYLARFSNDDLKFFKANEEAFFLLSALIRGAAEPLPVGESELERYFKQKSGVILNDNPTKLKKFLPIFKNLWNDSLRKNTDPSEVIGAKIREWSKPSVRFFKPSLSTRGGHLIYQFSAYINLDPKLEQFLYDNPDIFKMVFIGLGEGVVAASNLSGMLWAMKTNESHTTYWAPKLMDARRKNAWRGSILPSIRKLLVATPTGYIYDEAVARKSILRFAELDGIGLKQRKKLNELMGLYNFSLAARRRLNSLKLPKDMRFYGDTIDLALKVAKGQVKDVKDAKAKGYIAHEKYLKAGFRSPEAIRYIKRRGLDKWVDDNEPHIINGEQIYKKFLVKQDTLTESFSSHRLREHVKSQHRFLILKRWFSAARTKKKVMPIGGGMVPMEPLLFPKQKAIPKPATSIVSNLADLSIAVSKIVKEPELVGPITEKINSMVFSKNKDGTRNKDDKLLLDFGNIQIKKKGNTVTLSIPTILKKGRRSARRRSRGRYKKFTDFVEAVRITVKKDLTKKR
jgi:hypothetical protein